MIPAPAGFTYFDQGRGELDDPVNEIGFSLDVGKRTFFAHVAQSLLVEIEGRVPWSMGDLSDEHRAYLLDSQHLYRWSADLGTLALIFRMGRSTPGDPGRVFATLEALDIIRADERATILALLEWCRGMSHHRAIVSEPGSDRDVQPASRNGNVAHWQYEGFQPVERVFTGTVRPPQTATRHWTAGCHGTAGFLRHVLRTVNIPATKESYCGHAIPHFLNDETFLSHGDDLYDARMKWTPEIPMREILLSDERLSGFFDNCDNVGRGVREALMRLPPDEILQRRCRDIESGAARDDSEVLETFSGRMTVAELEAERFWERLDEEITRRGGCAKL